MKSLSPAETVRPRLEPYGDAVVAAYAALLAAPSAEHFDGLADAILRALSDDGGEGPPLDDALTLQGDLGLDSIGLAEAAFLVEDVFGHRLDNASLQQIHTVGDLRRILRAEVWQPRATAFSA